MKIDDIAKLADAASKIVGALAWPMAFIVAFIYFAPALKAAFANADEFTFSGGGFEATVKQKKAEVSAALFAASVFRQPADSSAVEITYKEKQAANLVASSVDAQSIRRASKARILWVDNDPESTVYERQALEAMGVSFVTVRNDDEAMARLRSSVFNVIISDMNRPPDIRAGYTLLKKLKKNEINLPFIIYSSSDAQSLVEESNSLGAFGSTNQPTKLFAYVLSALNL
ncbi:response regulator [Pseudomonas sp. zfem004]|uniref:response regulator n=1 Tax=Pseudomonas sp. zfem004 TaxID=3078199 RepID=UPI0029283978|nr:response regulator [Pseudomonas sp. zfem004]MDU9401444.1 response regulator [Pseudomonas sp. zfem004]